MKNILFILSAILFFSSCSKDNDNEDNNPLIGGTWRLSKIVSEVNTENQILTDQIKRNIEGDIFKFTYKTEEYRKDSVAIIDGYKEKYYIKNNKLYIGSYNNYTYKWEYVEHDYFVKNNKYYCYYDKTDIYQSWNQYIKVHKAIAIMVFQRY